MKIQFDPNAPAFGEGSQKVMDGVVAPAAAEPEPKADPEPEKEPKTEPEQEIAEDEKAEPSVEEQQVPYSRFKKFHDIALTSTKEIEELKRQYQELIARSPVTRATPTNEPPSWWVNLYGDSPDAKQGWDVYRTENEKLREEMRRDALEAIREEQRQETARQSENLETIDDHLESVSAVAGRDLTEREQSVLLDIIDDYTPKDENGKYLGAMLSPDKAWEIYELKREAQNAPKKQSRDAVATLTSPRTEGQPDGEKAEKDKAWNPLDWSFLQKIKN